MADKTGTDAIVDDYLSTLNKDNAASIGLTPDDFNGLVVSRHPSFAFSRKDHLVSEPSGIGGPIGAVDRYLQTGISNAATGAMRMAQGGTQGGLSRGQQAAGGASDVMRGMAQALSPSLMAAGVPQLAGAAATYGMHKLTDPALASVPEGYRQLISDLISGGTGAATARRLTPASAPAPGRLTTSLSNGLAAPILENKMPTGPTGMVPSQLSSPPSASLPLSEFNRQMTLRNNGIGNFAQQLASTTGVPSKLTPAEAIAQVERMYTKAATAKPPNVRVSATYEGKGKLGGLQSMADALKNSSGKAKSAGQ